jgi:Rps23 Pro-64 3,4-dihydroxylase Tpa1-like proline 4-hydroxylase
VLDLGGIASTPRHGEPYTWGYARHAIALPAAARLLATFPQDGFWRLQAHDGEKYYHYAARPLVALAADNDAALEGLHPAWRAVVGQLVSREYRAALGRAAGCSLDGAVMEASAWRWGPDAQLGPHLDLPSKIVTQVFYLTVGWDPAWGGCLRILRSADPDDTFRELPPALGSASVLVRSDCSWHSVTRAAQLAVRRPSSGLAAR